MKTRALTLVLLVPLFSADPSERIVAAHEPVLRTPASDVQRAAADRFVGRYRFAGGTAEREAVARAIDEVVAQMNPLARPIARDRLARGNRVPDALEVHREGDLLWIAFDDRKHGAALDGSSTTVEGSDGSKLEYNVSFSERELRQSFEGDRGRRENRMRRIGDGEIVVQVEVRSDHLPKPLRYRLSFARS
jgi:hypothetical protein